MVLDVLSNSNGVKTLKVRDLVAVKIFKIYVTPISLNLNFHIIFHSQKSNLQASIYGTLLFDMFRITSL